MISRTVQTALRQVRCQSRTTTPIGSLSALSRLLSSLAILEQKDGKLVHASLGAVTAAQKLGGSITAFVAGPNIQSVAEEASKVSGVEKVVSVDNAAYEKVCRVSSLYTT